MLASPVAPTVWRAPTDNDRRIKADWRSAGYEETSVKCYGCELTSAGAKTASVRAEISLGTAYLRPILKAEIDYTFFAEGGVRKGSFCPSVKQDRIGEGDLDPGVPRNVEREVCREHRFYLHPVLGLEGV